MAHDTDRSQLPRGIRSKNERSYEIRYTNRAGKQQTEIISGDTKEQALQEAVRQLAIRRGAMADGVPVSSKPHTVTFRELCADVVADYQSKNRPSAPDMECRYRLHLLPYFGMTLRAADMGTAHFTDYINHRKAEGAKPGCIARELEAAKRAFLLAVKSSPPKFHHAPHIPKVEGQDDNVREGFFEQAKFDSLCRYLPDHLIPACRFGYLTGWRHQEVLNLTLGHVHMDAGEIRLEKKETKNKKGRTFPITDELNEVILGVWPEGPAFPGQRLFRTKAGDPIHSFYKSWTTACRKAGLPVVWVPLKKAIRDEDGEPKKDEQNQLILEPVLYKRGPKKGQPRLVCRAKTLFHDFRRTAYRNLIRLGTPAPVARLAVGWLNSKTADRYDIPDQADLRVLRDRMNDARSIVHPTVAQRKKALKKSTPRFQS